MEIVADELASFPRALGVELLLQRAPLPGRYAPVNNLLSILGANQRLAVARLARRTPGAAPSPPSLFVPTRGWSRRRCSS